MHWMNNFIEKVEMKYVNFARKMLDNPLFKKDIPTGYEIRTDGNYIIKDCYVTGYTVKDTKTDSGGYEDKGAVYFAIDTGLIQLGESYYPPLRFSIPKSQLKTFETDKEGIEQKILITEWAYENCYCLPMNKIYENWGRMLYSLIREYDSENWDTLPTYTSNPYRNIIEELKKQEVRKQFNEYKKIHGTNKMDNIEKNNGISNKRVNETPFRAEAVYTFYTDGAGNLYNNEKRADHGHFSVYLENTEEKWKRKEDRLTSNQAELLGVMSCISIIMQRFYKNTIIYTDSKFVIGCTIKDINGEWEWGIKSGNVMKYVKRLREMVEELKDMNYKMELKYVNRNRNPAHAV